MTARVSMFKSRASLKCFRACFLPGRDKDLSARRYNHSAEQGENLTKGKDHNSQTQQLFYSVLKIYYSIMGYMFRLLSSHLQALKM